MGHPIWVLKETISKQTYLFGTGSKQKHNAGAWVNSSGSIRQESVESCNITLFYPSKKVIGVYQHQLKKEQVHQWTFWHFLKPTQRWERRSPGTSELDTESGRILGSTEVPRKPESTAWQGSNSVICWDALGGARCGDEWISLKVIQWSRSC